MLKTEMDKKPLANEKSPEGETNEEQDYLDIFVAQCMKIVKQIAPKLQGKASIDVLGNALFTVVNKVETEGAQKGVNFPLWVIIRGTQDILIFLLDSAQVEVTEESVKAIIGIAVGKYMQNAIDTGKITKEQAGQIAQEMQQQVGKGSPQEGQQAPVVPTGQSPVAPQPVAPPNPQMPVPTAGG